MFLIFWKQSHHIRLNKYRILCEDHTIAVGGRNREERSRLAGLLLFLVMTTTYAYKKKRMVYTNGNI